MVNIGKGTIKKRSTQDQKKELEARSGTASELGGQGSLEPFKISRGKQRLVHGEFPEC